MLKILFLVGGAATATDLERERERLSKYEFHKLTMHHNGKLIGDAISYRRPELEMQCNMQ